MKIIRPSLALVIAGCLAAVPTAGWSAGTTESQQSAIHTMESPAHQKRGIERFGGPGDDWPFRQPHKHIDRVATPDDWPF